MMMALPMAVVRSQAACTTDLSEGGAWLYENSRPVTANITSPTEMARYWGSSHRILMLLGTERVNS